MDNSFFGGVALRSGPVRPIIATTGDLVHGMADLNTGSPGDAPWLSFKTLWFSEPSYQGPFLIRGQQLDGSGQLAFDDTPTLVPLVVPPGPTVNDGGGYREAPGATWVMAPGCYAWQVDGLTFSEVIVVEAVLPAKAGG